MPTILLGYESAKRVVLAGRTAFFGDANRDLPKHRSLILAADDQTPQFGFVGLKYPKTRVLLMGINPGNGKEKLERSPTDSRMMPALVDFAKSPTPAHFARAQEAYKAECRTWHIWKRHCNEIVGAGGLLIEEIAYSNCLPWRTGTNSAFDYSVAKRAAALYVLPLIEELQPIVVVALGKRAGEILRMIPKTHFNLVIWNRAQAATPSVMKARAKAAAELFQLLGRRRESTQILQCSTAVQAPELTSTQTFTRSREVTAMYDPPKSLDDLTLMAAKAADDFEVQFNDLHHFSKRPPFRTPPSGFLRFAIYCRGLSSGIRRGKQNERTIQRAYRFLELRNSGASIEASRTQAWREFQQA